MKQGHISRAPYRAGYLEAVGFQVLQALPIHSKLSSPLPTYSLLLVRHPPAPHPSETVSPSSDQPASQLLPHENPGRSFARAPSLPPWDDRALSCAQSHPCSDPSAARSISTSARRKWT